MRISSLPQDENRTLLWLALWIALSCNLATLWTAWPSGVAVDYAVFWRAVNGQSDVYAHVSQPFVYPPTALIWFQPLKLVSLWTGFILWSLLSVGLFWAATARLYGMAAAGLAIVSPAILLALVPGQTSLLAAAGLFLAFSSPPQWRGFFLGAVFTFKPQLVALAPLFLLFDRDLKAALAMAATVGCVVLLATLIFGLSAWSQWLTVLPHFQQVIIDRGFTISAASPAAIAPLIGLPRLPAAILGSCIALWILARSRGAPPAVMAASVATASLLSAPYALKYDFVAIAPLMSAAILGRSGRSALAGCVAYTATLGPLCLAASAYVNSWRKGDLRARDLQTTI